jgi:hypothetical protein
MIDCKECNDYAEMLLKRGDIEQQDVNKVALDRHILKGCKEIIENEIRKTEDRLIELREMLND